MHTPLSAVIRDKGSNIYSAHPGETVFSCVEKMAKASIGSLLIIDETGLVGMFTERDITTKVVLQQIDTKTTLVGSVMTYDALTVTPNTGIDKAMELMTEKRFRHLPVVFDDQVVGLISIGDLTRWMVVSQQQNIEQLVDYIHN